MEKRIKEKSRKAEGGGKEGGKEREHCVDSKHTW